MKIGTRPARPKLAALDASSTLQLQFDAMPISLTGHCRFRPSAVSMSDRHSVPSIRKMTPFPYRLP